MKISTINEKNVDFLKKYILDKDLKKFLEFYKLENNFNYYEKLEKQMLKQICIPLMIKKDNIIIGFMLGNIEHDSNLNSDIVIVEYTIYEDLSYFELMLEKMQKIAKEKNCEYVSVCIPEFQKETLKFLNSTGFNNYKVELEKELI